MSRQIFHEEEHTYKNVKIRVEVKENWTGPPEVRSYIYFNEDQDPKELSYRVTWLRKLRFRLKDVSLRDRIDNILEDSREWVDNAQKIQEEVQKEE